MTDPNDIFLRKFVLFTSDKRSKIRSVFPPSRWFLRFPYRHGPTGVESSEKFKIQFSSGIERDTGFHAAKLQGRNQTFDIR